MKDFIVQIRRRSSVPRSARVKIVPLREVATFCPAIKPEA